MCGCGGGRSGTTAPAITKTATKYDLLLPSGRVLTYLTAVERDAAAAFYGITLPDPNVIDGEVVADPAALTAEAEQPADPEPAPITESTTADNTADQPATESKKRK